MTTENTAGPEADPRLVATPDARRETLMTSDARREIVATPEAPRPGGTYSQAVRVGDIVWTAGFGPADPATGQVGETVADQTRQVLRNVAATLRAAGFDLADVVKTTVHLADLGDFAEFDAAYAEFLGDVRPARTTVGSRLAGIKVEIDVVAAR